MDGEELIRDVWRRWNAGEREPDDESFDPEIAVHSVLARGTFTSHDGLRRWVAEIDEQFGEWELGIEEVRELAPARWIVHGSISARGRHSGVALDQPASWLIETRDGRMRLIRNFIGPHARDAAEEGA